MPNVCLPSKLRKLQGQPCFTSLCLYRSLLSGAPESTLLLKYRNMPGRVSVRSSRSSATSKKTRNSASEDGVPDEGPSTTLRERVCLVFTEVQKSNTGHRKLIVALRKVQEACCYEPADSGKYGQVEEEFDENDFNIEVTRCLLRVLPVKKSEPIGDRIVRFTGVFLKHVTGLGWFSKKSQDPKKSLTAGQTMPSSQRKTQSRHRESPKRPAVA